MFVFVLRKLNIGLHKIHINVSLTKQGICYW